MPPWCLSVALFPLVPVQGIACVLLALPLACARWPGLVGGGWQAWLDMVEECEEEKDPKKVEAISEAQHRYMCWRAEKVKRTGEESRDTSRTCTALLHPPLLPPLLLPSLWPTSLQWAWLIGHRNADRSMLTAECCLLPGLCRTRDGQC